MLASQSNLYFTLFALLVVLIAAFMDVRYRLIPNRLVFPGIACAVIFHAVRAGWGGAVFSLTGMLGGSGLLFIPFLFRWVGAGDTKLMGFAGAVWGWPSVLEIFLLATVSGGLLAVVVIMANPRLLMGMFQKAGHAFSNLFAWTKNSAMLAAGTGRPGAAFSMPAGRKGTKTRVKNSYQIPYGIAIAVGVTIWLAMEFYGYPLNLVGFLS